MKLLQSLIVVIASAASEDDNSLLQNMANRQVLTTNCQPITNVEQCQAAAGTLGLVWKQAKKWKSRPQGCIRRTGRQGVAFNSRTIGPPTGTNSKWQVVCLSPSSSPEADLGGEVEEVVDTVVNEVGNVNAGDVVDAIEDTDLDDVSNAADTAIDEAVNAADGVDTDDVVDVVGGVDVDDVSDAADTAIGEAEDVAEDVADDIADKIDTGAVVDAVEEEVDGEALGDAVFPVWSRLVEAISSASADDEYVCVPVEKGEFAPVPGQYKSNSGKNNKFVDDTEEAAGAPEDGQFCVEYDTTNWDDAQAAINDLDEEDADLCFGVDAGDAAPLRGHFTPAEQNTEAPVTYSVRPGDTAPVAGEYCVELLVDL